MSMNDPGVIEPFGPGILEPFRDDVSRRRPEFVQLPPDIHLLLRRRFRRIASEQLRKNLAQGLAAQPDIILLEKVDELAERQFMDVRRLFPWKGAKEIGRASCRERVCNYV